MGFVLLFLFPDLFPGSWFASRLITSNSVVCRQRRVDLYFDFLGIWWDVRYNSSGHHNSISAFPENLYCHLRRTTTKATGFINYPTLWRVTKPVRFSASFVSLLTGDEEFLKGITRDNTVAAETGCELNLGADA